MSRRRAIKPRKNASQRRSRATVDSLVEATARILVREGFDKASTNRIAEVSGVSIGSLYQYFPGKEALVAQVMRRHQEEIQRLVQAELPAILPLPVEAAMRRLVAIAVEAHRVNPRLHRVLAEQIPRVGALEEVDAFNRDNYALFRRYLEQHREEIRVRDLDLATFVCVTSIEALTHSAVLHHPALLSEERLEALIDEGTRLVTGYLRGSPS